ncbi:MULTISPECIES: NUDIX hydrolase [Bacillaceae]|uniref:DNA mismatch repair protein MutT n=1 Tax=Alkalicoccobacillus plakortidis TaxID=444060 RepID=A0A9D5I248_9BACI|nr:MULTISPECIES: NUDIX domain-containing protein [Bacillaceae]KQL58337.1 DNA mismatch repair protein MutT [Alkalicoccobacillus plakortidis]
MFIVNVEGAVWNDGKWLVIERSSKEAHAGGLLSLVGGKVDASGIDKDVLEKTIQREFLEEVGLKLKNDMVYVRNTTFAVNGKPVIDIVFLCEREEGSQPSIVSADEVADIHWMTFEEIQSHSKAPDYFIESICMAEKVRLRQRE